MPVHNVYFCYTMYMCVTQCIYVCHNVYRVYTLCYKNRHAPQCIWCHTMYVGVAKKCNTMYIPNVLDLNIHWVLYIVHCVTSIYIVYIHCSAFIYIVVHFPVYTLCIYIVPVVHLYTLWCFSNFGGL